MTSPKYMVWLIEWAWGYMSFNMNAASRQGWGYPQSMNWRGFGRIFDGSTEVGELGIVVGL
jgi:hypothetical protein